MLDRRQELESALLDTALHLSDPALRRAFITQACGGDPALRERLEALLADDARASALFPKHALSLFASDPADPAPAQSGASAPPSTGFPAGASAATAETFAEAGATIGRYRLVRRLGEGGCGIVYLAEQQEPVRREVALKIIRLGMDTERVIARFELERQTLALMSHPHIARVLDAGATATGRPYFVMEVVNGVRITDHCDTRRLSVEQRIELFIPVCLAIQHAHQKGVLHRDIKPSNVLVLAQDAQDDAPVAKVIDFGIAKAIGPALAAADASLTRAESFIGTPAYMSPEQAGGADADIDTRSDIYALGALLHELLVGAPPFDARRLLAVGVDELRRILREQEPPALSARLRRLPPGELAALAALRRTEPRHLTAALRGDIECIVARALEKDPLRRYVTAHDLARDLRRCLRHEAVDARPPSRLYRLRKLLRRNRVLFSALAGLALALFAGLGVSSWLYLREREALRRQTILLAEAQEAEKLTQAVFFAREGKFEEADHLLEEIQLPLVRPTFDGATAFRLVGDWLATQRRWRDCADRFAVLNQLARFDHVRQRTIDHLSYGTALLEADDTESFARFEREIIAEFADETDGEMNSRLLRLCLLSPSDAGRLRQLEPYAAKTLTWFDSRDHRTARFITAWAAVPIALWAYRHGDYPTTLRYVEQCLSDGKRAAALDATLQVILAMTAAQTGRDGEIRVHLDQARTAIAARFHGPGNGQDGFWFDWAYADLLLREADALLAAAPLPAD